MTKIQGNELSIGSTPTPASMAWGVYFQEHADYERKASEYALAIVGKYPDKVFAVTPLATVALGSLAIFKQLCELMAERHMVLMPELPQNLYLKQLNWLARSGREERFLDRLLLGCISESRCAAKFKEISSQLEEQTLSAFYSECATMKQTHADRYMELAYQGADDAALNSRFDILKAEEEKIVANLGSATCIF